MVNHSEATSATLFSANPTFAPAGKWPLQNDLSKRRPEVLGKSSAMFAN
jgi:hypothetical protein